MAKCPECGANADLTKDGLYAHCASCNTIFEPGKEGSEYRGSGSGSGDGEEGAAAAAAAAARQTDDKSGEAKRGEGGKGGS